MNWKLWLYGLVTAVVAAGATAATNALVLPSVINGVTVRQLLIATGLNAGLAAIIGALAYLKTHPLPEWDGTTDRRVNGGTNAPKT